MEIQDLIQHFYNKFLNKEFKKFVERTGKKPSIMYDYYYHVSPFDFGHKRLFNLIPQVSNGCTYWKENGIEYEERDYEKIVYMSRRFFNCLVLIPADKLQSIKELFIYKTIRKELGYVSPKQSNYIDDDIEVRCFNQMLVKQIGKISNADILYEIILDRHYRLEACDTNEEQLEILEYTINRMDNELIIEQF
jgi:hypothetical protein